MRVFLEFGKPDAGCAAHSLAEVYASLTRMPGQQRMTPADALLFLETLQERLTIVALDAAEYVSGIQHLAAAGIIGGTMYDGILALCAMKANAETIYTWNLRHFQQFGSEVKGRLSTS
jgi:predicted nucleic acid-binding protein